MAAVKDDVDDRFSDIDLDNLLSRVQRRPLTFNRKTNLLKAPEFLQRLSGEETVDEGNDLTLSFKVVGLPKPTLRWFKDDDEVCEHPRLSVEQKDDGGYRLTLHNVNKGDEAAYRCRAENSEGSSSCCFFLSVKGKPKSPKRDGKNFPCKRTVSYPTMFSTIVEKVEEEEKAGKETAQAPESPLSHFYNSLTLHSRQTWPSFLGDWAFVNGTHKARGGSTGSYGGSTCSDEDYRDGACFESWQSDEVFSDPPSQTGEAPQPEAQQSVFYLEGPERAERVGAVQANVDNTQTETASCGSLLTSSETNKKLHPKTLYIERPNAGTSNLSFSSHSGKQDESCSSVFAATKFEVPQSESESEAVSRKSGVGEPHGVHTTKRADNVCTNSLNQTEADSSQRSVSNVSFDLSQTDRHRVISPNTQAVVTSPDSPPELKDHRYGIEGREISKLHRSTKETGMSTSQHTVTVETPDMVVFSNGAKPTQHTVTVETPDMVVFSNGAKPTQHTVTVETPDMAVFSNGAKPTRRTVQYEIETTYTQNKGHARPPGSSKDTGTIQITRSLPGKSLHPMSHSAGQIQLEVSTCSGRGRLIENMDRPTHRLCVDISVGRRLVPPSPVVPTHPERGEESEVRYFNQYVLELIFVLCLLTFIGLCCGMSPTAFIPMVLVLHVALFLQRFGFLCR